MMSAASEVYAEKQETARALLVELGQLLDSHQQAQAVKPSHWGYVGDLAHVEERLKEVVGFLRPVEEEDDDSVERPD